MGFFDSSEKTKSQTIPYAQFQLDDLLRDIRRAGDQPMSFYEGQTYAGFDPLQEQAMEGQVDYAQQQMPRMIAPAQEAWQATLAAPDVANNPYVQGMINQQRRAVTRNLQEDILPALRDRASLEGGVGGFGGTGHRISEGIAARGASEALADQVARTQMQAYSQGLGQQRYGLGFTPTMMGIGMSPYQTMSDVGGARQAMAQRGIDEAIARHEFAQMEPWRRAEMEAGLYTPLAAPYAARRGKTTTGVSPIGQISQLGGLAMGLGGLFRGGFGG